MKQRIYGISGAFVLLTVAGCSAIPPKTVTTNETGNGNAVAVVGTTNADQGNTVVTTTTGTANENDTLKTEGEEVEVDTSDWLTYEDQRVGLKFKYPSMYDNISLSYSDCSQSVSECDGSRIGRSYSWTYSNAEDNKYYSVAGASTEGFAAGRDFRYTDSVQYFKEGENYFILLPNGNKFVTEPIEKKQSALGSAIIYSVAYLPSYPMMSEEKRDDVIMILNFDEPVNEFKSISFYIYDFMSDEDIDQMLQSIEKL